MKMRRDEAIETLTIVDNDRIGDSPMKMRRDEAIET